MVPCLRLGPQAAGLEKTIEGNDQRAALFEPLCYELSSVCEDAVMAMAAGEVMEAGGGGGGGVQKKGKKKSTKKKKDTKQKKQYKNKDKTEL
jgi:hypothetical protein